MFSYFSWMDHQVLNGLGILGFGVYVVSYSLLTLGRINSADTAYFALNLCASSLVLISLTASFNLASAMIQMFWVAVSILAICLRLWGRPFQAGRQQ